MSARTTPLRVFRRELELTQEAAARQLGVSRVYVSVIERGLERPSERFRRRVREVFGADLLPIEEQG